MGAGNALKFLINIEIQFNRIARIYISITSELDYERGKFPAVKQASLKGRMEIPRSASRICFRCIKKFLKPNRQNHCGFLCGWLFSVSHCWWRNNLWFPFVREKSCCHASSAHMWSGFSHSFSIPQSTIVPRPPVSKHQPGLRSDYDRRERILIFYWLLVPHNRGAFYRV